MASYWETIQALFCIKNNFDNLCHTRYCQTVLAMVFFTCRICNIFVRVDETVSNTVLTTPRKYIFSWNCRMNQSLTCGGKLTPSGCVCIQLTNGLRDDFFVGGDS